MTTSLIETLKVRTLIPPIAHKSLFFFNWFNRNVQQNVKVENFSLACKWIRYIYFLWWVSQSLERKSVQRECLQSTLTKVLVTRQSGNASSCYNWFDTWSLCWQIWRLVYGCSFVFPSRFKAIPLNPFSQLLVLKIEILRIE